MHGARPWREGFDYKRVEFLAALYAGQQNYLSPKQQDVSKTSPRFFSIDAKQAERDILKWVDTFLAVLGGGEIKELAAKIRTISKNYGILRIVFSYVGAEMRGLLLRAQEYKEGYKVEKVARRLWTLIGFQDWCDNSGPGTNSRPRPQGTRFRSPLPTAQIPSPTITHKFPKMRVENQNSE